MGVACSDAEGVRAKCLSWAQVRSEEFLAPRSLVKLLMPPLFCNVQEYKAVEKRLEELERANYLLDDSALEMLARLPLQRG